MTPSPPAGTPDTGVVTLSDDTRHALAELVSSYVGRRPGWEDPAAAVQVLEAEVMSPGRPGVIDVVAELAGRGLVHVPIGLRAPGDESRFLPDGEDPVLGLFEDGDGLAVAFDAARDVEVAALLLMAVAGENADPALVRQLRSDDASVTLGVEDRLAFTVFNDVVDGPRPGLEMLVALDKVGFNHLPAPLSVWRRGGRDLGIVQEYLVGGSTGWALALTSVRDLYGAGGPPDLAGGDFGAEAHRIGTMTARMHLGLDQAFGRRPGDVGAWADALEAAVAPVDPGLLERPEVVELLDSLRQLSMPCHAIRTHGDFHLGRVWRTEQGWFVVDFEAAGTPTTVAGTVEAAGDATAGAAGDATAGASAAASAVAGSQRTGAVVYRSPLADVADMLWSFGHVASVAAEERDPSGREGLNELAAAWEQRNRTAFLAGYLGVPGIGGLVPPSRDAVRVLEASFELERAAARFSHRSTP